MQRMVKRLMDRIRDIRNAGEDPVTFEAELLAKYGRRCAVAAIDSSGFTKTTNAHGIIHALTLLSQKRDLVLPALKQHGCFEHITEADSFIALFPDVNSAVNAVLEADKQLQHVIHDESSSQPYEICAGIGYGTLLITGDHGEFFGPDMNLASKLGEDTADKRELLLTSEAFNALVLERQPLFSDEICTVSGNTICFHKVHMSRVNA
ncbi:hypothetical protein [Mariprofundus sp. KV]|uniref:hypothetical protein n=1 Tax=Mariprofundus sp. KV TaxID=2608715 RepID=UPI0015A2A7A5|nr:hypothetical protein [Mariprofundus sp. KV]NWF35147.1 hypothetical protein [Mariprofundus sp. KV]